MNIFKILDSLQQVDGDAIGRIEHATRRMFMNRVGSTLAAAAVPTVFASIVNKAYAQSATPVEVLNFALTLEYLEETFYFQANRIPGLIPGMYSLVFQQIEKHENQHVTFLKGALGSQAVERLSYDFTAGGMFPTWSDFPTFVTVATAFEDTGVRAYKGQAGNLISQPQLLEYALQVHSVEARHASIVRKILGHLKGDMSMKSWITESKGFPADVYLGATPESNTVHLGIDAATLAGIPGISKSTVTESFDEPLTMAEVLKIAGPFIKGAM
jgi:rubrerythrin